MKPKILFIMHMPPPIHGAAMMGKYIHDSKLINKTFNCMYINPSASSNVKDVGKINISKILFFFKNTFKIINTAIKEKPNLCYYTPTTTGWGIYRDMIVIGLLKLLNKKIVLHLHNKGSKEYNKQHPLSTIAYKIIFSNVKVIQLSEFLYKDIQKFVQKENVFICHNGIPQQSSIEKRNNSINNKKTFSFLFLSNMMQAKGVWTLVDACKILQAKGYKFTCTFVGNWADISRDIFEQKIKSYNLEKNIVAVGPKYGTDKKNYFLQADAFVFPSHSETFGLVLLEAMEYGLPCIASNEGGIPSIIKNHYNGILFPTNDHNSLAIQMEKLINNPLLAKEMGVNGEKLFHEKFTLRTFESTLNQILTQILQDS